MSKRVLKWSVPVDNGHHEIGAGKVLHVHCQFTPELVQVWTEESELTKGSTRLAQVYGTGQEVPYDAAYLGTTVTGGGALVWHLYEHQHTPAAP
jgi:hypothetical protein